MGIRRGPWPRKSLFSSISFFRFFIFIKFFFVVKLDILVAMGIIKSHYFVVNIFLIFGLCASFFYLSRKRYYSK